MKKYILYCFVAIITFLTGVTLASILKVHFTREPSSLIKERKLSAPQVSMLELIPAFDVSVQSRKNPDGWFTLDLPNTIGKIEQHADVDGGLYSTDTLEINYDYWTFQNTPNWLRGNYAKSLLLYCTAKDKNVRTWRTRIDGKKAVLQRCSLTDSRKGFRHVYYVTFPRLRVSDGQAFHPGMFNLRVEYKDPRHSGTAARIIYSLDFQKVKSLNVW